MMFPVSKILERMFCDNGNYIVGVCPPPPSLSLSFFLSVSLSLSLTLSLSLSLSLPHHSPTNWYLLSSQTILRTGLVILSGLIVICIPNFSTLMALIGSSCCTLLAFILPGIFHYVIFRE